MGGLILGREAPAAVQSPLYAPPSCVEGLGLGMIAQETGTGTSSSRLTFLFFLPSFGVPVSYSVELASHYPSPGF
jgi:hypothetical protein